MAYSCWAALSATYRTLSRSFPNGRCRPCFSRMPKGSRHVPCARVMASRKSAAVSSSQCTESLLGADGDCADMVDAKSAVIESSDDVRTCSPLQVVFVRRGLLLTPRERTLRLRFVDHDAVIQVPDFR